MESLKCEAENVVNHLQQWLENNTKIKIGSKPFEEKEEEVEDVEVFQMVDGGGWIQMETIRYPKRSWMAKLQRQFRRLNPMEIKRKLFSPKVNKSYSWTLNPGVDPTV